jgi:hypothetical protein
MHTRYLCYSPPSSTSKGTLRLGVRALFAGGLDDMVQDRHYATLSVRLSLGRYVTVAPPSRIVNIYVGAAAFAAATKYIHSLHHFI